MLNIRRMKEKIIRYRKWVIVGVIGLVTVFLGLWAVDMMRGAKLSVLVAPVDAVVKVNGEEMKEARFKRFFPGEVLVEVSREGLTPKKFKLELEWGKVKTVEAYLVDANGEFDFYLKKRKDFERLKLVAKDEKAKEFIKTELRKMTLGEILPLSKSWKEVYPSKVDGRWERGVRIMAANQEEDECQRFFCLKVVSNTGEEDTAKAMLKEKGYNYEDYEVVNE